MGAIIGVDLGTTNSCVVVMDGSTPTVIPNQEGARTTPSVVAFTPRGETLVGQVARRQAVTNPQNTIYAVKRLIGRRFDSEEVRAARALCPYTIVEGENGTANIRIGDSIYSPPEIEAIVLSKLKAAAEDYLGERVEDAIVSVPAYFNDSQRQATKDAGEIAGLHVQRILNEASAASLAYGMIQSMTGKIAVYDLGGGTFDISIVELNDGIFQVLATGGNTYLGGEDFDELVMKWLVEKFQTANGIDLTQDSMALQRLKHAAEKAKCELSTLSETEVVRPFISADESGPKHLKTELTRVELEQMIAPMLEYTGWICLETVHRAGLTPGDIDGVVAVGGQTRTPAVIDMMTAIFGKKPLRDVNPDEVVATGTAIQTGITLGTVTDCVLLDVTPYTLGIETKDNGFTPLVERNANIPTKKSSLFTTVVDNQPGVEVHVLQGESESASDALSLGKFLLTGIPPAPAGKPEIEVTFEIDVDGIVYVTAQDLETGAQRDIVVRAGSGLSRFEIYRARLEIEKQARDAVGIFQRRQLVDQLQASTLRARRAFELLSGKLTERERDFATVALDSAGKALDGTLEDIHTALEHLQSVNEMLGQAMLRG